MKMLKRNWRSGIHRWKREWERRAARQNRGPGSGSGGASAQLAAELESIAAELTWQTDSALRAKLKTRREEIRRLTGNQD